MTQEQPEKGQKQSPKAGTRPVETPIPLRRSSPPKSDDQPSAPPTPEPTASIPPLAEPGQTHAVIIGGGMAGLFAGRVLAAYMDRVTIIERDHYPDTPANRKGVPQALHLHNMVNQGWSIMEGMYPGLGNELVKAGAVTINWPADLLWLGRTGWSPRFDAGIRTYSCKRQMLEWHIQRRMAKSNKITFLQGYTVTDLLWSADRRSIEGVRVREYSPESFQPNSSGTDIPATIVVDASGKLSQTPRWLTEMGYATPREEAVKAYVGYATRYYRLKEGDNGPDWKVLLEQSRPPDLNRAAGMFRVENNEWVLTLVGMGSKNNPPTDEEGFHAFMQSLPSPAVYDFVQTLEPISPIYSYRVPQNRLLHYEELTRWPERFLILGDAVCVFNPVYGHGISVIAQSIVAMEQCLHEQFRWPANGNMHGLSRRFQQRLAKVLSDPWMFTVGEDLRYPTTEGGKRDLATQMLHFYIDGVMMYALENPDAHRTLIQVMHLVKPPTAFLRPDILVNALALNMTHSTQ